MTTPYTAARARRAIRAAHNRHNMHMLDLTFADARELGLEPTADQIAQQHCIQIIEAYTQSPDGDCPLDADAKGWV